MNSINENLAAVKEDQTYRNEDQVNDESVVKNCIKRFDLSDAVSNTSMPLHQLANMQVDCAEAVFKVTVFDLKQIYIHDDASLAITNAHITPLFLVEAAARNTHEKLLRVLTRGNDKGLYVLDSKASTYVHRLSDGSELVVQGETVEVEGAYTRQLTITCRNESALGGV